MFLQGVYFLVYEDWVKPVVQPYERNQTQDFPGVGFSWFPVAVNTLFAFRGNWRWFVFFVQLLHTRVFIWVFHFHKFARNALDELDARHHFSPAE